MFQITPVDSYDLGHVTDEPELRDGISVSIHPLTARQWQALLTVAADLGGTRSDLLRDAIARLLDERDAGVAVIYAAAPRIRSEADKVDLKPRIVWVKSPLAGRLKARLEADSVSQSEFILEALRRHLKAIGTEVDPPI